MSYRDLFDTLNDSNVRYVIPRRYDALPEQKIEESSDVDILVDSNQFERAIDLCRELRFVSESPSSPSRIRVYRRALSKPTKAARQLIREPKESIRKIIRGNKIDFKNPRHRNVQLHRDEQVVDFQSNLAYKSPMNESLVPVSPEVTDGMLSRRERRDCFYIPTPPDELAHLIPRCVFDKDGNFPPYYRERCDELFRTVQSDDEYLRLFKHLLSKVFFNADHLVYDHISESRYDELRRNLKRFADY